MKRKTEYIICEKTARAIKKITGSISDEEMKEKYKITDSERDLLSEFFSLVLEEDEE